MADPVYITQSELVDRKFGPATSFSSPVMQRLIREHGRKLDRLLGGHFNHMAHSAAALDGKGTSLVSRTDMLPFIKVNGITIGSAPSYPAPPQWHLWPGDGDVSNPPRAIEAFGGPASPRYGVSQRTLNRYVFPRGGGNIVVDGVWGWLDRTGCPDDGVSTSLVDELTPTSTSMTLADASDVDSMQVLQVTHPDSGRSINRIASSIDGSVITIDPYDGVSRFSFPAGSVVTTYGRVPDGIADLMAWFMFNANEMLVDRESNGSQRPVDSIKRERTDDYEIEFFGPAQLAAMGRGSGMTGNAVIDQLLADFCAPATFDAIPMGGRTDSARDWFLG